MDPVIEKLNILKKIALDRKSKQERETEEGINLNNEKLMQTQTIRDSPFLSITHEIKQLPLNELPIVKKSSSSLLTHNNTITAPNITSIASNNSNDQSLIKPKLSITKNIEKAHVDLVANNYANNASILLNEPQRNNKYLQKLLNNYQNIITTTTTANGNMDNLKRKNEVLYFNDFENNGKNSTIDKIKQKLNKRIEVTGDLMSTNEQLSIPSSRIKKKYQKSNTIDLSFSLYDPSSDNLVEQSSNNEEQVSKRTRRLSKIETKFEVIKSENEEPEKTEENFTNKIEIPLKKSELTTEYYESAKKKLTKAKTIDLSDAILQPNVNLKRSNEFDLQKRPSILKKSSFDIQTPPQKVDSESQTEPLTSTLDRIIPKIQIENHTHASSTASSVLSPTYLSSKLHSPKISQQNLRVFNFLAPLADSDTISSVDSLSLPTNSHKQSSTTKSILKNTPPKFIPKSKPELTLTSDFIQPKKAIKISPMVELINETQSNKNRLINKKKPSARSHSVEVIDENIAIHSKPILVKQSAMTKSCGNYLNRLHKNHQNKKSFKTRSYSSSLTLSSTTDISSCSCSDDDNDNIQIYRRNKHNRPTNKKNRFNNNNTNDFQFKENLTKLNRNINNNNNDSSDDSVCGIPKSFKLCSNGKSYHKSMDDVAYQRNSNESPKSTNNKKISINNGTTILSDGNLFKSKSFVWDSSFHSLNNKKKSSSPPLEQLASKDTSTGVKADALSIQTKTTASLSSLKSSKHVTDLTQRFDKQSQKSESSLDRGDMNFVKYDNNWSMSPIFLPETIKPSTTTNKSPISTYNNNNNKTKTELSYENYTELSNKLHSTIQKPIKNEISLNINQDNDKDYNNIKNQEILTTNEQTSTMPQSEAILEKLKKFEPQLQPTQQAKRHAVYVSSQSGSLNEQKFRRLSRPENEHQQQQLQPLKEKRISISNSIKDIEQKLFSSNNNDVNKIQLNATQIIQQKEQQLQQQQQQQNVSNYDNNNKNNDLLQQQYQQQILSKNEVLKRTSLFEKRPNNNNNNNINTSDTPQQQQQQAIIRTNSLNNNCLSRSKTHTKNLDIQSFNKTPTKTQKSIEKDMDSSSTHSTSSSTKENKSPSPEIVAQTQDSNANKDDGNDEPRLSVLERMKLFNPIQTNNESLANNKIKYNRSQTQAVAKIITKKDGGENEISLAKKQSLFANISNKQDLNSNRFSVNNNHQLKKKDNDQDLRLNTTEQPIAPLVQSQRELKRYSVKAKTEMTDNLLRENSDNNNEMGIQCIKTSIQERMAALKKNGEDEWKKRNTVTLADNDDSVTPRRRLSQQNQQSTKSDEERPKSIKLKINELQADAENWKKRVPENDAQKFTVAAKIDSKIKDNLNQNIQTYLSPSNQKTPLSKLINKSPTKQLQQELVNQAIDENEQDEIIQREQDEREVPLYKRVYLNKSSEIITNPDEIRPSDEVIRSLKQKINKMDSNTDNQLLKSPSKSNKTNSQIEKVELFSTDSELDTFFKENENIIRNSGVDVDLASIAKQNNKIDLDDVDFDQMVSEAQRLTHGVRVKPSRKTKPKGNHLKNLQNRIELKNDYEQESKQTGMSTPKSLNIAQNNMNNNQGFTKSALAGLASKEDFSSVKLKHYDSQNTLLSFSNDYNTPYNDIMLIQIKGRRNCQPRLVEPKSSSLNSGDCFLLKTLDSLFLWIGEYSNIIEKSKSNDIYDWIRTRRDLGLKNNAKCVVMDEKSNKNYDEFWSILGRSDNYQKTIQINDDEKYEYLINDTNIVYRVVEYNDEYYLEPIKEYWGCALSFKMLNDYEVYVFDFGSEVYVWNGSKSDKNLKHFGLLLGKKIYEEEGFDYTKFKLTPLMPQLTLTKIENEYFKGTNRPTWTLFARLSQNVETVLFKEKFFDWPSESIIFEAKKKNSRLSYKKSFDNFDTQLSKKHLRHSNSMKCLSSSSNNRKCFDYKPIDGKIFLNTVNEDNPVNLVLEQFNLGRGRHWFDVIERRAFDIKTDSVLIWRVSDNQLVKNDDRVFGEFEDTDTFIIKWSYKIIPTGFRNLKGCPSQMQSTTGRDRHALFFWHGSLSSQSEKGASALLINDLGDDTRSMPHVQVFQFKEFPAFLQLFSGKLVIFRKRNFGQIRMFTLRGSEIDEENYLIEIEASSKNLRSKTSLILVSQESIFVWFGRQSPENHQISCIKFAELLKIEYLHKFKFQNVPEIKIINENDRYLLNDVFLNIDMYHSIEGIIQTPRLFHLSSMFGTFDVKEVLNPCRSTNYCPYPFYQFQLIEESQPALFLFDNNDCIYIWQGWFDGENESDSSAKIRFNIERKCAFQTAINYWNARFGDEKIFRGYIVYAGIEPIEFTNLFPFWNENEEAKEYHLKQGKENGQIDNIEKILAELTQDTYPLERLRQQPLPDGVDPFRLECYLTDDDFQLALGVTRDEFNLMPVWKQQRLKQQAKFF